MAWAKLGSGSVSGTVANTSWKELARASGTGTSITTDTFAGKDNLMILTDTNSGSSTATGGIRFNADTGTNYANRFSTDDGSDTTTQTSATNILNGVGYANKHSLTVGYVVNIAGEEKLTNFHVVEGSGSRREVAGKWANTSNQITSATLFERDGNGWGSTSEIVVLGMDNDEADSGTNFWQELASQTLTSNATTTMLDTGTFTAKKYLMVDYYLKSSTDPATHFNNDTGNNYYWSYTDDGGSQSMGGNPSGSAGFHYGGNEMTGRVFIVNVADKDKQYTGSITYSSTSGAGSAPVRRELAGRWTNTSDQITQIRMYSSGQTGYTGSFIKVYGAD